MKRAEGRRKQRADRDDTATRGGTDPTGSGPWLLRHGPLVVFLVAAAVRAAYLAELASSPLADQVAGDGEAYSLWAERITRTHISRILTKLGLENRVQAALYGLRSGLVSISETTEVYDARWQ